MSSMILIANKLFITLMSSTVCRFLEEEWKHLRKNPPSDISISDTIWEDLPRNIHKENVDVSVMMGGYFIEADDAGVS